jgi:hypothetical protein
MQTYVTNTMLKSFYLGFFGCDGCFRALSVTVRGRVIANVDRIFRVRPICFLRDLGDSQTSIGQENILVKVRKIFSILMDTKVVNPFLLS